MSNPVQPPTASTVFGGSSPAAPGATDLPDAYGNPTVGTPAYNARAATRTQLLQAGYKPGTPEYDAAYTQQAQAGGYADSTLAQMKASGAAPPRYIDPNSGGTFYDKGGTLNTFTGPQGLAQLGNQNAQYLGGQQGTAGALASGLQMQAAGAEGRGGPAINTAMPNFFAGGVGQGIQNAQGSNLAVAQNALNMAGTATGAGYQGALGTAQALGAQANGQAVQGQFGAAQQLQGMAGMPAGPSVAQQQLRMGSDAAMQQQMAMAAGARGGNTALASANAGAQQGAIEGQLNQNQALLRAQEDMANRTFSANALQGAAGIYGNAGQAQTGALGAAGAAYGQAAGIQQAGYGNAGQAFQGIANNQLGQAAQANALTSTYAGMAGQQLGADMNQRTLNDQTSVALQGLGVNTLDSERAAALTQQGQNLNVNLGAYGANIGQSEAANARSADLGKTILGGAIAAGGVIAAPFTGGASLAAVPTGVGMAASGASGGGGAAPGGRAETSGLATDNPYTSDITSKKNISAAGEQVSDAIRGVQVPYPTASGGAMQAPAYAYEYKDPNSAGARPGAILGGSIAAAGAVAAPFTGGASLAAVPIGAKVASDVTMKSNIAAAPEDISNAFRMQSANAAPQGALGMGNMPQAQQAAPGTSMGMGQMDLSNLTPGPPLPGAQQNASMQGAAGGQQMALGGQSANLQASNSYAAASPQASQNAGLAGNNYGLSASGAQSMAGAANSYGATAPQHNAAYNASAANSYAAAPAQNMYAAKAPAQNMLAGASYGGSLVGQNASLAAAPNYGAASQNASLAGASNTYAGGAANRANSYASAAPGASQNASYASALPAQSQASLNAQANNRLSSADQWQSAMAARAPQQNVLSDERTKNVVQGAHAAIDQVYRDSGQTASNIRNTDVPYPMASGSPAFNAPGYQYTYKDADALGAAPGVHYGPMAQDLEKTPAGASVVVDKGGKKSIDTGRLTLLNTSELSKMRQELDALSGNAASIRGAPVSYPQPVQPAYRLGGY